MFKVVITDCLAEPASIEREILDGLASVECWEARSNEDLAGRLADVDAVIVYHEVSMSRELMAEMKNCKIITRGGVGYDNIDLAAAEEFGILVTHVPHYGVDEVADHAIGLMLALRRGLCASQLRLKESLSPWDRGAVEPLQRLAGQTFGVIGCGRIGTAAALRAKAFRMDVVFYDPYLPAGIEKALGLRRVSRLEELLKQSDVVSIHAPLTDETRGLIDSEALRQMGDHAVLLNTARGAIVDTAAVATAIEQGRLAGAGIDVLPREPATSDDALVHLWRSNDTHAERVILTAHTAYYSEQALEEIRHTSASDIGRVLSGGAPHHVVRQEQLYQAR